MIDTVTGINLDELTNSELNEMGVLTPHECVDWEVQHDGYDAEYAVCRECDASHRVQHMDREGEGR